MLTGLATAPRGVGTLIGMFAVGRLLAPVDARPIIAVGLGLTALSLWQMTQFSLQMDYWPIAVSGIPQGMAIGLVYVPLSTVAFTTLPGALRNEGTALFSLMRNIGSSIGISVVMFLLTQNTQRLHQQRAGGFLHRRLRLGHARLGDRDVLVVGDRLADRGVEAGRPELRPPARCAGIFRHQARAGRQGSVA